jgi:hypothetical protein
VEAGSLREAVAGFGLEDTAGADKLGKRVAEGLRAHAAGAELVERDGALEAGERGHDALRWCRGGFRISRCRRGRRCFRGERERGTIGDELHWDRTVRWLGAMLDGEGELVVGTAGGALGAWRLGRSSCRAVTFTGQRWRRGRQRKASSWRSGD